MSVSPPVVIVMVAALLLMGQEMTGLQGRPLELDVVSSGETATLVVAGSAPARQRVRYTLTVEGQSYTRHAGSVTLDNERQTVSRVRVPAKSGWTATLFVESEAAPPYRITRKSEH
ncbi:hypothetical protein COC42_15955 [Sphingomonas spermidinifaciens]|uniref:Curli assembly protein CsgC n=1 Tax=Sphingomonas spermidinifaciens TaxID=1141889 RepID=A0A2A4B0Z7_9SPHN|nr:curli-like amyloid fiber formation chaperone CsgH [Sphingomonas spermidinifaciens]PCD01622.1 hypothetical protein COC42_15955 [Sphingomonas spermidinifaciens]